jgi:NACHT domain
MGDIDPNKVVVELFTSIVKDYGALVKDYLKSPIARLIDAYRFDLTGYLSTTFERCSKVKTFLNRDDPVSLLDVYVKTKFKSGQQVVSDEKIISNISHDHNLVILGSAGSGKSMFMKYLFIQLSQGPKNGVPLLIELRRLAQASSRSLIDFIYDSLVTPGAKTTPEQFVSGLKHNLFTILLDGFDEVDIEERAKVEKEILELRDRYPKLPIIVSSRDDERVSSWERFRIYRVLPLDQKQVVDLIKKSKYDNQVKQEFIKSLKSDLYRKHESFLSNPLLTVMMLITFKEIAHIPNKLHIFYEQAFDALYFKHDAAKETAYRRKIHSELPIDEFKRCLSCFCVVTYSKERFSFTESEITDYICKAIEISKVNTQSERFLADLFQSVCILRRDGLHIVFTHRSFQEYFAASFLDKHAGPINKILNVLARRPNDIVITLLFDINRSRLEREWVMPELDKLMRRIRAADDNKKLVNMLFGTMTVSRHGFMISPELEEVRDVYSVICRLYDELEDYETPWSLFDNQVEEMLARSGPDLPYLEDVADVSDQWIEQLGLPSHFIELTVALSRLLETIRDNVKKDEELVDALLF